ncbi:MAG: hypothetical protein J2P27_16080 [Actinobacteria bacterium]|nr:hypothetical protein [Actinomycetota bacterium]
MALHCEGRYVNLATIPAWGVVLGAVIGLALLGVTLWFIAKPRDRHLIPLALAVLAGLALIQTAIQQRGARVAAWFIVVLSLTMALSALGRRGGPYAKYRKIERRYGPKSRELNSYAMKLALRIILILAALLVLSAFFVKGAYTQRT